ncbi:MAG TPA: EVE domain-containing protein [Steroidobacteraceae bacterium]|nr:EVE domain-containing protein [Steroidobacteraceae bacterium]
MQFWLLKTEPESFGIDDLQRAPRKTTAWDGVRNYQARNMLRDQMQRGDQAFLYHSSCEIPGITGIVEVVKPGYPDATAFDAKHHHHDPDSDPKNPRWYVVDVKLIRRLPRVITLDELRKHAKQQLAGMVLLRPGIRLSVMPVAAEHWKFITSMV